MLLPSACVMAVKWRCREPAPAWRSFLKGSPMDLTAYPTELLLKELNARGTHGVASLISKAEGRMEVWWGNRVQCLGLAVRLTSSINMDMDKSETIDESDEGLDDDAGDVSDLEVEFPQMGQYL